MCVYIVQTAETTSAEKYVGIDQKLLPEAYNSHTAYLKRVFFFKLGHFLTTRCLSKIFGDDPKASEDNQDHSKFSNDN